MFLYLIVISPKIMIDTLLSAYGKIITFPHKGIIGQTVEAKNTSLNATIGQAYEDDGSAMQVIDSPYSLLYASPYGKKELREYWQKCLFSKNPSLQKASLPIVTNGLTHGLYIAGLLFLDPGEMLTLPDLFWDNYAMVFHHAQLETFPHFDKEGFNLSGLEKKLSEGKTKFLLTSPNNPTGYALTTQEAEEVCRLFQAADREILILCDDAYFGLFYEENVCKESLFAKLSQLDNVLAVKIDGVSKELFAWGLRVGFVTYTKESKLLEDKTAAVVRATISSCSTPAQQMVLHALSSPDVAAACEKKYHILKERYHITKAVLRDNPQYTEFFEPLPFNAGYFMCIALKQHNPEDVRKKLLIEYSTGVLALGNLLRIAYSSVFKENIPKLFDNIYHVCKNL